MSVTDSVEARCPACGAESQATVWRSINATLDPEAKTQLLAGIVNVFTCPKCRYESLLDIDLLYHDMEQGFCVQYYPYERLGDDGFLAGFGLDGRPRFSVPEGMVLSEADYFTRPHIVFELGELVRYVAFRDRLHELAAGGPPPEQPS
jgi:RNA polymerase subunit RPABC4/transcription elongation factor Spt4